MRKAPLKPFCSVVAVYASLALAGAVSAQTDQSEEELRRVIRELRPSKVVPARPFDPDERPGQVVDYELGSDGGWFYWPPLLQWRWYPLAPTTDPTVQVTVYPPYSGNPTNAESFILQFPAVPPASISDRALVIGFHSFNVSENQIFGPQAQGLWELCQANGWMLLAPRGLNQVHFGNEPSQRALEQVLALVYWIFEINPDRIYTFGFSMGGLSAMSFAFRHQDPYALRIAGVVHHTGTVDVVRDYETANVATQQIFETSEVFGGSPAAAPFNYDRVNPTRFNAAGDDFLEDFFQLDGVFHTPFYLHRNSNDPQKILPWNVVLDDELLAKGFTCTSDVVTTKTPEHNLATIDFADAFNYVGQFSLGPLPTASEIFADRPGNYLYTEMIAGRTDKVARYNVSVDAPSNTFTVNQSVDVTDIGFDLGLMGIDPAFLVSFFCEADDGAQMTYVLKGYPAAPSSIAVNGGAPVASSYDPATGNLSITPTADGSLAFVQITP